MGLMNASGQFQQMMDDRIEPVADIANAYIDDIIIGTRAEPGENLLEAHNRDIRRVLQLLKEEQLIACAGSGILWPHFGWWKKVPCAGKA